jgi:hypothetical protein
MVKRKTLFITILVFSLCVQVSLVACQESRRPSRYLIPKDYVGWVKVYFKVKDASPLKLEDGRYLFMFPTTGRLETSSENEYGVGPVDEYFYYSDDTRQPLELARSDGSGMIWAAYNGHRVDSNNQPVETYEGFFVGTEEDYRDYGCQKDENGQPKTGPVDKRTAKKCNSQ